MSHGESSHGAVTAAQSVRARYEQLVALSQEIRQALKGRMVRVLSDHNGQPVGRSRKSWRGQERKIVGVAIDDRHGIELQLQGHEFECFIDADEVEMIDPEEPVGHAARLFLVGGPPGAGKTFVGRRLAARCGLLLDKDTLSQRMIGRIMELHLAPPDDRDSQAYASHPRALAYRTMMDVAHENLQIGRNVVCVAPFQREFASRSAFDEFTATVGDLRCETTVVWVRADAQTIRHRIEKRAAARDAWKLEHFDEYMKSVQTEPPSLPNVHVFENSHTEAVATGQRLEALYLALGV